MQYKNRYNLPEPLVSVVENDTYTAGDSNISTTSLVLPPRIVQLTKRHGHKIYEDVSDNIYKLIGSNTHYILERIKTPNCIKEKRYYTEVWGWRIGGKIDLYEEIPKILSDYKITSVWAVLAGIKPEHEQQLNINSYLMTVNGIRPEKLQVVNFLRDWSKHKAKEHNYPSCQVVVQDIPLWSLEKSQAWIEDRVRLHQEAENTPDDALLPCSFDERWEKVTQWAVMGKNRKSAFRLLNTEVEAQAWMEANKGDYIEERKGEAVRCLSYCSCNVVCSVYLGI